jgi:hypothetical protein
MDVLVVALAGPAANLLAAVATGVLAAELWSHGILSVILWLTTLSSVLMAIGNLYPTGEPGYWLALSDGRWAQLAWRAMRTPAAPVARWEDPHAATSVAPPSTSSTASSAAQ